MNTFELATSLSDCTVDNLLTLRECVRQLSDVPGVILEFGSYRCGATIAMAEVTDRKILAFDMFGEDGGLPYGTGVGFENFANNSFAEVARTVSPYKNIFLVQGRHEDTVPEFKFEQVSMVFLDSDHYASHKIVLEKVWPVLSPGGLIAFHDWSFPGVQRAINEVIGNEAASRGTFHEPSNNMGFIRK